MRTFTLGMLVTIGVLSAVAPSSYASRLSAVPQVDKPNWDYSPSVMDDAIDGKRKIWWCSEQAGVDVVRYQQWLPDGSRTAPQVVLQSSLQTSEPDLAWEGVHTCDPTVTRGSWNFNGNHYSYVMYYTTYSPSMGAAGNRIGAAFSNDGKIWTKNTAGPVIYDGPSGTAGNFGYGTGQSVVWSADAAASVRTVYTFEGSDHVIHYRYRESSDGITFGSATEVTKLGLDAASIQYNPGLAIAPGGLSGHYYYYLSAVCEKSLGGTMLGLCVYRVEGNAGLFSGTWQKISTPGQLQVAEFEPGFVTDLYGGIPTLPRFELMYGCGEDGLSFQTWGLCVSKGNEP